MGDSLLLVSASGLARETAAAAAAAGFDVLGFLDDDERQWGNECEGVPILGGLAFVDEYPDARVVICTGKGSIRATIAARLADRGLPESRYATVIHPSVTVPASCSIGPGTILLTNVVLTTAVTIGAHCVVMPNVTLTHDNVLSDFVTIAAGVSLGGWTHIGAMSYLGMNAGVRERVRLGAEVTIGMGAVVLSDVSSGTTVVGNPARPLTR